MFVSCQYGQIICEYVLNSSLLDQPPVDTPTDLVPIDKLSPPSTFRRHRFYLHVTETAGMEVDCRFSGTTDQCDRMGEAKRGDMSTLQSHEFG